MRTIPGDGPVEKMDRAATNMLATKTKNAPQMQRGLEEGAGRRPFLPAGSIQITKKPVERAPGSQPSFLMAKPGLVL